MKHIASCKAPRQRCIIILCANSAYFLNSHIRNIVKMHPMIDSIDETLLLYTRDVQYPGLEGNMGHN